MVDGYNIRTCADTALGWADGPSVAMRPIVDCDAVTRILCQARSRWEEDYPGLVSRVVEYLWMWYDIRLSQWYGKLAGDFDD